LRGQRSRKPIGFRLWVVHLRIKIGSNISRVLYFFYIGQYIILTNGFIKKTQKTPTNEIIKAKKYRADYLHRKED